MASTKERLAALRSYLETLSADKTTFIVEGGREFIPIKIPLPICWSMAHIPRTGGGSCSIPIPWRGWMLFHCRSIS